MRFSWDEKKNTSNARKHKVSFEEARSVFLDEEAILYEDPDHPADETRYLLLGLSLNLRVLVVVHCVREDGDLIRIISARKATTNEREAYAGGQA